MIIFLCVQFYSWWYGVELSETARMAFMVFSILESIIVSAFLIEMYIVGKYESRVKERRNEVK